MEFRYLGNSGLKVSAITYGNWLTHGDQIDNDVAKECVKAALDAGITSFDTADAYANTKAERVLGKALHGVRRQSVEIFTKVYWPTGPMGPNDSGLSRKHLMESIDGSLERLDTDYVDLYQAHRYDVETPLEETMLAFADIVRAGKALYIGVSEWPADRLREAKRLADELHVPFVSNQPHYNMIWRVIEPEVVPTSRELGLSQVVWSPMEQGLLTGKYLPGAEFPTDSRAASSVGTGLASMIKADPGLLGKIQNLRPVADELELTMAQLAIAWVLQNDNVAAALVGASKPAQIASNAKAAGVTIPAELMARIDEILGDSIVRDPSLTWERTPKQRPS